MPSASTRRTAAVWGILAAAAVVAIVAALATPFDPVGFGPGQDARAYWAVSLADPYIPGSVGHESAYLYSPAFIVATSPLRILPWPVFVAVWTAMLLAVLYWMTGPILFLPVLIVSLPEIWGGNVTILLAAAVVAGFRWAGTWALPLLTKVTPGVGVLWFAVRREWLPFGVAIATTCLVIAGTAVLTPSLWHAWFELLATSTGSSTVPGSVPIPFIVRLPLALVVIAWAARRDVRWLLPIGVLLAMPVVWWGSLSLLAACVAFERGPIEAWLSETGSALQERVRRRRGLVAPATYPGDPSAGLRPSG